MINATENGFDVVSNKEVFTLICDNEYWYVKHTHKGTAQIGVQIGCIALAFDSEEAREQYIYENKLIEFVAENNSIA